MLDMYQFLYAKLWFSESYLARTSSNALLDEGINHTMFEDEFIPPDPGALSLRQLRHTQTGDLPGFGFFYNDEHERGEEVEPLTEKEKQRILGYFGKPEQDEEDVLEAAAMKEDLIRTGVYSIIYAKCDPDPEIEQACARVRYLANRQRKKPWSDIEKRQYWNAVELLRKKAPSIESLCHSWWRKADQTANHLAGMLVEWNKRKDRWVPGSRAQLLGLKEISEVACKFAKLRDSLAEMRDILHRLRTSLERDNIGDEWTGEGHWFIGHREGIIHEQARVNDQGPRLAQDEPDDQADLLEDKPWQEAERKRRTLDLLDNLWNMGPDKTITTRTGKQVFVKHGAKMLSPDESNHFVRKQDERHARFVRLSNEIHAAKTDEVKLQRLKQRISKEYAHSVARCVPKGFLGKGAIRELLQRGYKKEQLSEKTKLQICANWNDGWLTAQQKDILLEQINEILNPMPVASDEIPFDLPMEGFSSFS